LLDVDRSLVKAFATGQPSKVAELLTRWRHLAAQVRSVAMRDPG